MKRILIFVGLKITEIGGVIALILTLMWIGAERLSVYSSVLALILILLAILWGIGYLLWQGINGIGKKQGK